MCILTLFESITNCRESFKNKNGKCYIMTLFETIWNYRELLETRTLNKVCILTLFKTAMKRMIHVFYKIKI